MHAGKIVVIESWRKKDFRTDKRIKKRMNGRVNEQTEWEKYELKMNKSRNICCKALKEGAHG